MEKRVYHATWAYCTILSFVVVLITAAFIYFESDLHHKTTSDIQMDLLSQMGEEIDLMLGTLNSTVLQMSNHDKVINIQKLRDAEKCELLGLYEGGLSEDISLLFFFRRTNSVYYQQEILSYHTFEQSGSFDPALDHAGFFTKLSGALFARLIPVDNPERRSNLYSAAFIAPVPLIETSPSGSAAFLVRRSYFDRLVQKYFDNADIVILDAVHSTIYDNSCLLEEAELSKMIRESPLGTSEISIDGTPFILLRNISLQYGFNYLLLAPKSSFFQQSYRNNVTFLTISGLILCLGLFCTVALSKSLRRKAAALEDCCHVSTTMLSEGKIFINQLVLSYLLGEPVNGSDSIKLSEQLQSMECGFAYQYFYVIVSVQQSTASMHINCDHILREFSAIREGAAFYAISNHGGGNVAVIVNTPDCCPERESMMQRASTIFRSSPEQVVLLGCGSVCDALTGIKQSYQEALISIDCKSRPVDEGCYIYDNNRSSVKDAQLFYADAMLIEQSIRSGSADITINVMRTIFSKMEKAPTNSVRRCIYFDIANILIKIAASLNLPLNLQQISKLSMLEEHPLIFQELEYIALNLTQSVHTMQAEEAVSAKRSMAEYVQANFRDTTLSLSRLAEKFGISYAYVSRTFKSETGQSFQSYLAQMRIEFVKEQLRTTDMPIKDIVLQSGYLDVANFMRKFKQLEGVTPGQYRQLHTPQGGAEE